MTLLKKTYITTPIYYANDFPHIGHAYTNILCDVKARFEKLSGNEVMFLSGTDEYGQKMQKSALDKGLDPHDHATKNSLNFRELLKALNCHNDDFIRTTEKRHHEAVKALWKTLEDAGDIYMSKYSGWYAVRDEAYYEEKDLTTVEGGIKLAPSGAEAQWIEEPSYFFKLSKYQDALLKHYADNKDFLLPKARANEVISFIKSGLKDISISRTTFDWGIPVPDNKNRDSKGDDQTKKHIIYVWLDALTNYIAALGYPDTTQDSWQFWDNAHHVIGKDILRFHGVYWPAFLLSAKIQLPKQLIAHGWWTIEGNKMSKSVGNVIDPLKEIEVFGVDRLRYFLCREKPITQDGDYSKNALINRSNADLANNIGNLAQRSLKMIAKHFSGVIETPKLSEESANLIAKIKDFANNDYPKGMKTMDFHQVLQQLSILTGGVNRYIDKKAPWSLLKQESTKEAAECLFTVAESLRCFAILYLPFIPDASDNLLDQLSVAKDKRTMKDISSSTITLDGNLKEPEPIFPKIA